MSAYRAEIVGHLQALIERHATVKLQPRPQPLEDPMRGHVLVVEDVKASEGAIQHARALAQCLEKAHEAQQTERLLRAPPTICATCRVKGQRCDACAANVALIAGLQKALGAYIEAAR